MIDLEFIKRCEKFCKPKVDEYLEKRRKAINEWNEKNREKLRESQRKYIKTKKGRIAYKRRYAIGQTRVRDLIEELSEEEIERVRQFYANCPEGYQVDHIVPLSRKGKHHVSNLQYLTPEENRKKRDKVFHKILGKYI